MTRAEKVRSAAILATHFERLREVDLSPRHRETLAVYGEISDREFGTKVVLPRCYRTKPGFTFKGHALECSPWFHAGDARDFLRSLNFRDEPTQDALVFVIPHPLESSFDMTPREQLNLLSGLRVECDLPPHHLRGFGSAGLVAGLCLVHEQGVPQKPDWVRTDTSDVGGNRVVLGDFGGLNTSGLNCEVGRFDDGRHQQVGAFAIGVEPL